MLRVVVIMAIIFAMMQVVNWTNTRMSRKKFTVVLWGIFAAYVCGNVYCTLFSRVPGSGSMFEIRPFMSIVRMFNEPREVGTEVTGLFAWFMKDAFPFVGIILNILLFVPLGYLLPILFPKLKPKHVILIGCLFSIATEATQYLFKMGWCETDDVIHNTLGTAIGVWVWHLQSRRLNKPKINELPKE